MFESLKNGACRPKRVARRVSGWLAGAAAALALSSSAVAQGGEPCNDCGPLDVVFIVDDTGSMGGAIAGIQAGITNIIDQIKCASDDDYQLGLITHSDCVQIDVQLASGNDAAMAAAVAALTASGGGGTPESSDAALNAAVNSLPAASNCCQDVDFTGTWRPTATKIVILITDAVPGGCDDAFTLGIDDVAADTYANDALGNNILISAINVLSFADPNLIAVMQNYADVTGGSYVEAPNGVGIETAISAILDDCGGGTGCATVEDVSYLCDPDDPGMVDITFTITNNSGTDAGYLLFTPQSPDPTEVLFMPNIMPVSLPDGSSETVTVTVVDLGGLGTLSGQEICFTVTLKQNPFELCSNCCSVQICVTPDCDCFQIVESSIDCLPDEPGAYTWTFDLVNLSEQEVHHLYFFTPGGIVIDTPSPANNYIYFNPPLAHGDSTGPIKVVIEFPAGEEPPAELCFWISLNDQLLNTCCKKEVCLELPDCDTGTPTGACCRSDGSCLELIEDECLAIGGLYLGDGVACGDPDFPCPDDEFGACCLPDGTCIDLIAIECEFAMGVFFPGTDCTADPNPCAGPVLGGCCLCDGTCVNLPKDECVFIGTYLGDFVFCGTPGVECPPISDEPGACCLNDGCAELSLCECVAVGGYFLGVGTVCSPTVEECSGACCLPGGACFETPFFFECDNAGGVFLGPGSTCLECPFKVAGDGNKDGKVDSDDLSGLLSIFGNPAVFDAQWDFNGDGVINSDDLGILLSSFGTGV
ncbi:MAG: VWA domain-containing protein [Phycisphaerales bacterium]